MSSPKDRGRISPPGRGAAGLKALAVTYEYAKKNTGLTRALRVLSQANQKHGFDCPGCAWPDPKDRSLAEFCENGAKAILDEATKRRANASFFEKHSIVELRAQPERWLNEQGRLTTPLLKDPASSHYRAVSYEEAYEVIAKHMTPVSDPNRVALYTSGRTSNEAAFLYQLFARAFGTNNLPDCSNLCHESSGVALKESLGIGKGTVRLSDFKASDLVFVIGQNPGTNHPRMLSALRDAKLDGTSIISVNPLVEAGLVNFAHPQEPADILGGGVDLADHFVRVAINGDLALFRGINKCLLKRARKNPDIIDRAFIEEFTTGFKDLEAQVESCSWESITEQSGVDQDEIERLTDRVVSAKSIICCWAMGLTQHQNAVVTIQEITNFLLLRGNVGRAGAGACPVRGHSNVQGDRSVGIAPLLPAKFRTNMEKEFSMNVPTLPGLDSVGTIQQMAAGDLDVFLSLGGNFLSACPDTDVTARALQRCKLTVQISTKLNRSHLFTGETALILPCLSRSEKDYTNGQAQDVSVENSMGIVHRSRGNLPPAAEELRSEPRIVGELAEAVLGNTAAISFSDLGKNYEAIREHISRVVPGFENYNQRLSESGGFELDNGPRDRRFTTPQKKAVFIASALTRIETEPDELLLMTLRSHDQFNTTVYTDNDRYRGISGTRKVLLMHPSDLLKRGLKSGTALHVTSRFKDETRTLQGLRAVAYDVPEGSAVAYFPEANPLIFLESYADRSRTPTSKSVRIVVREAAETKDLAASPG